MILLLILSQSIKWSWACRLLRQTDYKIDTSTSVEPKAGDLALVRIGQICNQDLKNYRSNIIREIHPALNIGCFIQKPVAIDYLIKRVKAELD